MYDCASINAPAKINLHLSVLDRRPDGFHNILSIVQLVGLSDTIIVSRTAKRNGCEVTGSFPVPPAQNIVSTAVEVFRQATGGTEGVRVHGEKRIPHGAGLGGGSSDAAATLLCLNEMFGKPLSQVEMELAGSKLGSDVPFFLRGPAAVMFGRGEQLLDLPAREDFWVLLVLPPFTVSTAEAYYWLDSGRPWPATGIETESSPGGLESLAASYTKPIEEWTWNNDFRRHLEKRHPLVSTIRADLYRLGAIFADVTGSGSALFGIFPTRSTAIEAFGLLSVENPGCDGCRLWLVSPLASGRCAVLK